MRRSYPNATPQVHQPPGPRSLASRQSTGLTCPHRSHPSHAITRIGNEHPDSLITYPDTRMRLSTGLSPVSGVSTGPRLALSSIPMMIRNSVYDKVFHYYRPAHRCTSRTINVNAGPHHAWRLRSPTPRFHKRQPLGRMGRRRSRTHTCRRYLPRALSRLCRAKLLTTPRDPWVVPKPSRYHLSGEPEMHLVSPLL